jgi:hypothetical protein
MYDPKLLFETEDAKQTNQKYALYKNWNEYIVVAYHERDYYLGLGYQTTPAGFPLDQKNTDTSLEPHDLVHAKREVEDIDAEIARVSAQLRPKRKRSTNKEID